MFMSLRSCFSIIRAVACAALGLMMVACSSPSNVADTGGKIWKVKYYYLGSIATPIPSADASIPFERDYHLYGAITNKQREARTGTYYSVMWKVTDRSQPVKVRLEYRQQATGLAVKTKEMDVPAVEKSNVTRFAVIGDEFQTNGPVTAWRVSLVRGKQVIAESKSYLWD
jgi:hypothetical protein